MMWWRIDCCNQVLLETPSPPTEGRNWTQCFTDVSVAREPQTCALINWWRPLTRGKLFKKKKKDFCVLFSFAAVLASLTWNCVKFISRDGPPVPNFVYLEPGRSPTTYSFVTTFALFYLDFCGVWIHLNPWFATLTYRRMGPDGALPRKIETEAM